jgi:hypothetical protein
VETQAFMIRSMLFNMYETVSQSFRTGHLERELRMVQLSAIRCSCIAILWVILVSFAAIALRVASQRVFTLFDYFVMTQSGNFWIHPRKFRYRQSHGCVVDKMEEALTFPILVPSSTIITKHARNDTTFWTPCIYKWGEPSVWTIRCSSASW